MIIDKENIKSFIKWLRISGFIYDNHALIRHIPLNMMISDGWITLNHPNYLKPWIIPEGYIKLYTKWKIKKFLD